MQSLRVFVLWIALLVGGAVAASVVHSLTPETFDDVTQLSTSGTGDWFVMFYSPSCPYYQDVAPAFDAVAKQVEGRVRLGKVDGKAHRELKLRFRVTRSPTFLFFHQGRMYAYKDERTTAAMAEFITSGFAARDHTNVHFKYYEDIPERLLHNESEQEAHPHVDYMSPDTTHGNVASSTKEEL
ncbi:Aste57867_20959 [Aphanomyces stellatus]|uniref:Aste57867_20959 protein n=1 Tax=Aphanomyces stellatus TaxID=120398 RepID=A0A485LG90_9STRA|nr:hypothetical protein As57867_020891 [Aphanomyces stellatus]VFT97635.1 Aste57867_20959 [Aphanomyces stellatus]